MEALHLASYALAGLQLLFGLIAGGAALATKPADAARICYQELALEASDPPVCSRDFTVFTMPDAGDLLIVRR